MVLLAGAVAMPGGEVAALPLSMVLVDQWRLDDRTRPWELAASPGGGRGGRGGDWGSLYYNAYT